MNDTHAMFPNMQLRHAARLITIVRTALIAVWLLAAGCAATDHHGQGYWSSLNGKVTHRLDDLYDGALIEEAHLRETVE